jgi:nickel/cobalt exporter
LPSGLSSEGSGSLLEEDRFWLLRRQDGERVRDPLAVLLLTTITTAAFHTLIPDHWLPFVLVSRTERWDKRKTAMMTAGSALLHVLFSIGLGMAALGVGRGAETVAGVGHSIERLSAGLMVLFGVAYAFWFSFKGGHQHSFGVHPHHLAGSPHPPSMAHPHDLSDGDVLGGQTVAAMAGGERAHHGAVAAGRGRLSGIALAGIVGFNPCVLLIPYIYVAGSMGAAALIAVALSFAVSTVVCMVGVVMIGLRGTARLESRFLTRYGEVVSGALIAVTGLVVMLSGR